MSEQDEQRDARPVDPDLTRRRATDDDAGMTERRSAEEPTASTGTPGIPRPDTPTTPVEPAAAETDPAAEDSPADPAPEEAAPEPVQRLLPPTQAIQRSRVAEEFVTHRPGQPSPQSAAAADDGRWLPPSEPTPPAPIELAAKEPGRDPVETAFQQAAAARAETEAKLSAPLPEPAAEPATPEQGPALPPEAYRPESTGGLGDQPDEPIVTLPPVAEAIAGYPLSERTGEPARNLVVLASMLSFGAAALAATAAYWWYWWVAINITNFHDSAALIRWLEPRPGSGSSVVLVCVMAVIGAVMTAGPGVAGYNVWHGASFSRVAGLAACGTSLLAVFVLPWAWLALLFSVIGTALLWTRPAKSFLSAWDAYANPPGPVIKPFEDVAYGPAPRYR